jgi:hypothetical protein
MNLTSSFIPPVIGFILTLVFGFWLGHIGKPYRGLLFNVHKLIALGAAILTTVRVYNWFKASEPQPLLIVLVVLAGLCVLALFASGAFLSIGNVNYRAVKLIHNIAPLLLVLSTGIVIYLIYGSKV